MYNANSLKDIIENVIDGILVIDQNGVILQVNPSACVLFGYTADELNGKNISMLMASPDKGNHDKYLKRCEHTKQTHVIGIGRQITAIKKNGDAFPARLAVSVAKYKNKAVYVGVTHDLSEEKKDKDKLQQHANELELVVAERTDFLQNIVHTLEQAKDEVYTSLLKEKEVNQLKTRFISIASHEFRTPLSSIQLSASLIEHYFDRLDKQTIFSHLTKIKSAVSNLIDILNDFLSVEKIETGKVSPIYREFDLKIFCEEIIDLMRMQLKEGQKIIYRHTSTVSKVILDSNMLRHSVINLISNAVKYSHEGGTIKLKTEITDHVCRICVADSGIGIPQEDQAHLFEAFFRAGNTINFEGTGLGLSIVKRYTDLMNGTITFGSSENSGTVFTLKFPITN